MYSNGETVPSPLREISQEVYDFNRTETKQS